MSKPACWVVYEQTRLLGRLVNDLHDLSQADAHQLSLNRAAMDIGSWLAEQVDAYKPLAEAQNITLQAHLSEVLPVIQADPARLSQVIGNLLLNAIRHTPASGTLTRQWHVDSISASGRARNCDSTSGYGRGDCGRTSALCLRALLPRRSQSGAGDGRRGFGVGDCPRHCRGSQRHHCGEQRGAGAGQYIYDHAALLSRCLAVYHICMSLQDLLQLGSHLRRE